MSEETPDNLLYMDSLYVCARMVRVLVQNDDQSTSIAYIDR